MVRPQRPQLSAAARAAISDPNNDVLVSPATYWEIAIKVSIGKYTLATPYQHFVEHNIAVNDFEVLPIEVRHTALVAALPFHHRDPFDRLLIAQALVDRLTRLDQAVDTIAIEVERISEGQRFLTKVMTENGARALGPGPAQPVEVHAREAAPVPRSTSR